MPPAPPFRPRSIRPRSALSKTAATQTGADLQSSATNIMNALFNRPDVQNAAVTAQLFLDRRLQARAQGQRHRPHRFPPRPRLRPDRHRRESTTTWGNTRLRVALVLDNTGSMASSNKMTALKTASQNLLTQLKDAATTADDVYVSIIPFNKDVNVGAEQLRSKPGCAGICGTPPTAPAATRIYTTQSTCTSHGKTWTPANHSTWNGCVTDRDQNYDTTNDAPLAGSTLYPAEQYSSCPAQLMGLSNDWTALSSKIDAMQPNGNTNQAIGLQAGWQSLTAAPFTVPAMDPNYKYTQVIILLTDGLNTAGPLVFQRLLDRHAATEDLRQYQGRRHHHLHRAGQYRQRPHLDAAAELRQQPTGTTDHFFLLTSSTEIVTTFNQIGTALSNLRLAM